MVLGDLDSYMQKNETRSPTYTIGQNKLKRHKQLIYKSWCYKSPRGKHSHENFRYPINTSPRARDIKERINKWDHI